MKTALPSAAFPRLALAGDADIRTVPALLYSRCQATPDEPALWELDTDGVWQSISWREFTAAVSSVACALRKLGLRRGESVGILAPSSAAWDMAQLGTMAAGAVVVGLDPHDTAQRLETIAGTCGLVGVIAQDQGLLDKLGPDIVGALRFKVLLESTPGPGWVSFAELRAAGDADPGTELGTASAADPALIVFTSGTTGEPRGISYTHAQVCGAVAAILQAFGDIEPGSRLACWLPLSNLFQRMVNLCAIGRGAQTYYIQDPRTVMQHLTSVAPNMFIGVPRFFEKLYAGMRAAIDAQPAWKRALARWALRAGDRQARAARGGSPLGPVDRVAAALAERLVLRKIRSIMGPDMRQLISGSAPMPLWLLEAYHAMGFLVLEAYGMSECIVPVAANRRDRFKFGTVGQTLAGIDLRLAPDGELLLRGPGVFSGYLGDDPASDRFDAEGFLPSGDFASVDEAGFITLLGRKSELFKTSTGRRVAPAPVESLLRQLSYVEHALVLGANRPFVVAVLAISAAALRERLGGAALQDDVANTVAVLRADIRAAMANLPDYQCPAGVVLTTHPFTVEAGQITPNLKLRRANVQAGHEPLLAELYAALASGPGAAFAAEREAGKVLLFST